ncbi:tyrosine-type recombinase/integrase [Azoarcus olearius]|uniref:Integrase n=1 Tax=Azoarcus sp. (strain BH72) TaxID=418699 RepID=A1K8Z6_AZOSB|nr:integrase arm-type DNA-binding domain-containing protein [Azoarcus olearius]CAL95301.1 putative integrase [Azoarcus olearius]
MPLTDTQIKSLKPDAKAKKYADEKGLFLLVQPSGGKLWRVKCRFVGKEKSLAFGGYPDVTLKAARERRDEARKLLAADVDPSEHQKGARAAGVERTANSFEVIAREWYGKMKATWVPSHGEKIIRRLERDIFPWLGRKAIAEITAPDLLATVRKIEDRGRLETAHRALQNCGQIFRYAIATGRASRDPSVDLRGALPPVREKHFAAIVDPGEVAGLLRAIEGFSGTYVVKAALQLAPLVFARPGELRQARCEDIDSRDSRVALLCHQDQE